MVKFVNKFILVRFFLVFSVLGCQSSFDSLGVVSNQKLDKEQGQQEHVPNPGTCQYSALELDFRSKVNSLELLAGELPSYGKAELSYLQVQFFEEDQFKQSLVKSFAYLFQFDEQLEIVHRKCMEQRGKNNVQGCQNPIVNYEYGQLQKYRALNEELNKKYLYFYLRLLDLANYKESSHLSKTNQKKHRALFSVTAGQFQKSTQEEGLRLINNAKKIILNLHGRIHKVTENLNGDNLLENYLMLVLSEVIYRGDNIFSDITGFNLGHKNLSSLSGDGIGEFYIKYKMSIKQQIYKEEKSIQPLNDDSGDTIVQKIWKNHTGNLFERGTWALTYDDGPKSSTTHRILDLLEDQNWHATFFWLAKNVSSSKNKDVVQRAIDLGMGLASHSYTHANLNSKGANLDYEIRRAKEVLEAHYGVGLNFFRLPYGAGTRSSKVRDKVASLDLEHFYWNVDSLDWKDHDPESIYQRVKKQMDIQGQGIILFHDIHSQTVEVTRLMIERLRNKIQIIKLEDGVGVGSANQGSEPIDEPEDSEEDDVPDNCDFAPHYRRVLANRLNVMHVPGVDESVCGQYPRGALVQIVDRDQETGWYLVETQVDRPLSSSCSQYAYISDEELLSIREEFY